MHRFVKVSFHTDALVICVTYFELCFGIPLLRCFKKPGKAQPIILLYSSANLIVEPEVVLCISIPLSCGLPVQVYSCR